MAIPAGFLAAGHMGTEPPGSSWIVRLDEAEADELRAAGGVDFEPMPGRPMRGFVSLPTDIIEDDEAPAAWIGRAQAHAATLPSKKPRKPKA